MLLLDSSCCMDWGGWRLSASHPSGGPLVRYMSPICFRAWNAFSLLRGCSSSGSQVSSNVPTRDVLVAREGAGAETPLTPCLQPPADLTPYSRGRRPRLSADRPNQLAPVVGLGQMGCDSHSEQLPRWCAILRLRVQCFPSPGAADRLGPSLSGPPDHGPAPY